MRLLLDSHYCLWLAVDRTRLRTAEQKLLFDPVYTLAFSSVAIWELKIKWDPRFVSGSRKGQADPGDVLDVLRALDLEEIDLTSNQAAALLRNPVSHRDPFDAQLLIVAQETDRILLTRDEKLRGHPLAFHAN